MAIYNFGPFPRFLTRNMVRRGNPLLRDLVLLVFPGTSSPELVTGRKNRARGGIFGQPDIYGTVSNCKTGSGNGWSAGNRLPIPEGCINYTIACLAKPTSTVRRTQPFSQYIESDSGNPQLALMLNADDTGTATAGKFAYIEYQSGVLASRVSTAAAIDGNWHIFSASRDAATTGSVYLDGADVSATGNQSSSGVSGASPSVTVAGQQGADRAANYPLAMVAVWKRTLTAVEHLAFAQNPWWELLQPLAPIRVYSVPAVSAGVLAARSLTVNQAVNRAANF